MQKRVGGLEVPRVEGFGENSNSSARETIPYSESLLKLICRDTEQIDELHSKVEKLRYEKILNPEYSENTPLTDKSEMNRTALLYALEMGIDIPEKYIGNDSYMTADTESLLMETFSEDELQLFQGLLVFNILRDVKGVERNNTLAMGGMTYTQSQIGGEEENIILGLYARYTAIPIEFKRRDSIFSMITQDIEGSVHAIPYGVTDKIKGKERETMLMLADDILRIFDHLQVIEDDNLDEPRFIMGTTNSAMALVAENFFGTQAETILQSKIGHSIKRGKGKSFETEAPVTILVVKKDFNKVRSAAEEVKKAMIKSLSSEYENVGDYDVLKKVRADAVGYILGKFDWEKLYERQLTET